ncbi:MAG: RsmD family RNA methyltransferase [Candidatus Acidiferrum sp.]
MRIIAGKYRSRILKSLKGEALRPTSDRLRETLFDILGASVVGSRFLDVFAGTGAVGIEALSRGAAEAFFIEHHAPSAKLIRANLDALGIAQCATILHADALAALQKLAARSATGVVPQPLHDVIPSEARNLLLSEDRKKEADSSGKNRPRNDSLVDLHAPAGSADLTNSASLVEFVFLDPPYANHADYARTLEFLGSNSASFLSLDALIIFEHHHKFSLPESSGRLTRTRHLKQGDAALSFFRDMT